MACRPRASPVADPLPDLGPGDLRGRRVFHEVVERDAAVARAATLRCTGYRPDVVASESIDSVREPSRERSSRSSRRRPRRRRAARSIWFGPGMWAVEDLSFAHGDEAGVRHPGAVVAVLTSRSLSCADASGGRRVGFAIGVVLDRDLRGHPSHGVRTRRWQVLITSRAVAPHERLVVIVTSPRSGRTRLASFRMRLDEAEDVVPAAAVEAGECWRSS